MDNQQIPIERSLVVIPKEPVHDIIIRRKEGGAFDVIVGDKIADHLGYDECLGLIASLIVPERRGCLSWLKTPKEIQDWEDYLNGKID